MAPSDQWFDRSAESKRNVGDNFVYSTLPVSFGRHSKPFIPSTLRQNSKSEVSDAEK